MLASRMMLLNQLNNPFQVRVVANASRNEIIVADQNDCAGYDLKIYVTVIAEDGKANKAVLKLLSKKFKCSKSTFTIISGQKNKNKLISYS
tara:strand:+ start:70 stop:342 length:273 start_codon:yes stop_codon:yes gene_type:complete